jgi:hypothetical protein
MTMTARILMVFFVALINLGLGFIIAVHLGRGPWSRHARRSAANLAQRTASQPKAVKSIEQIGTELEGMEHRLQELVQRVSDEPTEHVNLKELLSTLRNMMTQVEAVAVDETQEQHEQATAGIRTLLQVLQTATADLGRAIEDDKKVSFDAIPLLSNLQMACREVNMVFNALLFAELPT